LFDHDFCGANGVRMARKRDGFWKRVDGIVDGDDDDTRAGVYAIERGFVEGDERDGVEEDVTRCFGSGDAADDSGRHSAGERTHGRRLKNPGGVLLGGV